MSIGFRRATRAPLANANSLTVTLASPPIKNDIIFALLTNVGFETWTLPSGFTARSPWANSATPSNYVQLAWKRAAANEPSSYTFSRAVTKYISATIIEYYGITETGDPIVAEDVAAGSLAGPTILWHRTEGLTAHNKHIGFITGAQDPYTVEPTPANSYGPYQRPYMTPHPQTTITSPETVADYVAVFDYEAIPNVQHPIWKTVYYTANKIGILGIAIGVNAEPENYVDAGHVTTEAGHLAAVVTDAKTHYVTGAGTEARIT